MPDKMNETALSKTNDIFNKLEDRLVYLYSRWQDEKEYEDFNEYIESAKESVTEAGGTFVSMKKRPFYVEIEIGKYRIRITVTSCHYEWKRVA